MNTVRPHARTFGGLIAEMAQRYPGRPALSFEGRDISFLELDHVVDRWARALIALGVKHSTHVGILAGNRPEWLYVAMATARLGAVLVPLNTWYRESELKFAIDHGDIEVLFFHDTLRTTDYVPIIEKTVAATSAKPLSNGPLRDTELPRLRHVVELGRDRLPGALHVDGFLARGATVDDKTLAAAAQSVRPEDVVYLIYTSGSTARPKGVTLEHEHALVNTFNIGERQALNETDRSFLATPLFYGLGVIQALGATWTHGACVVLMEVFEPGAALKLLEAEKCTAYYGLGNMTRSLVEHPNRPERTLRLRKGVLGLSAADRRIARTELGLDLGTSIYGLTESYGLCALTDSRDSEELSDASIGRALPDWEIRIGDPDSDEPLTSGEVGHILIRGHVMSGYYKDPERNREVMTEDGFFRTGDLGRVDSEGNLYFHSRLSEMMKPGGINVSPLEVELLIGQIPGIREVHVVGIPNPARGEAIVAFVDCADAAISSATIIEHVRTIAAKYKTPHHVLFQNANELPHVASGKVPKTKLRGVALGILGLDEMGAPHNAPARQTTTREDENRDSIRPVNVSR